jgi:hypothetical protein
VHRRLGGDGKLAFTLCTFIQTWSGTGAKDGIRFLELAVRTNAAMSPDDGFEKLSANVFIGKFGSELIDIHNISSFFGFLRRYYQTSLSDQDKSLFMGYRTVKFLNK